MNSTASTNVFFNLQSAIYNLQSKGPASMPQALSICQRTHDRLVREHDLLRGARFAVDGNRDKVDPCGADSRLGPWNDGD